MGVGWASFEDTVRGIASSIWSQHCQPERIGGVDIDGALSVADDIKILIEITQRNDGLKKVRDDITKLITAKAQLQRDNIHARCYCIFEGNVTNAMKEAAKPHGINVLSLDGFARIFFDFEQYRVARERMAFGSAINPITGEKDDSDYVPVGYINSHQGKELNVADICMLLRSGKKIVLLGEYGTGKSRCLRQVFQQLSKDAKATLSYPMAIDLRESWGLRRWNELLRRHIDDLALPSDLQNGSVRALQTGALVLLLDGFDELGSQVWSNDNDKLRLIRHRSLEGVRDLISRSRSGMLICGREHYFNSNEEMLSAFGLDNSAVSFIRCKDEFTEQETEQFLQRISAEVEIPTWLPRRPLVCQTIADLTSDELDAMFGVGEDEISFFDHFLTVLCKRDARINAAFDPRTIERVLTVLARMTRSRPSNVGPITLSDVQGAFESVVGQMPVEDASVMLQRLPALGRVKAESNDRQFIDGYILDGLRAKDVVVSSRQGESGLRSLLPYKIINPLEELGQKVLAKEIELEKTSFVQIARRFVDNKNPVGACDVVASALRTAGNRFDFGKLHIEDGNFVKLDMSSVLPENLTIVNSVLGDFTLPSSPPPSTEIRDSVALRVYGVAAANGLPKWITNLEADRYDSVESVSRIKKIGLSPAHEILVTIIRKTFFQKGAGRKEEALTRGLGQIGQAGIPQKIINILINASLISKFKGDDGWVFTPNRSQAGRMKKILYELKTSSDDLWLEVDKLN